MRFSSQERVLFCPVSFGFHAYWLRGVLRLIHRVCSSRWALKAAGVDGAVHLRILHYAKTCAIGNPGARQNGIASEPVENLPELIYMNYRIAAKLKASTIRLSPQ